MSVIKSLRSYRIKSAKSNWNIQYFVLQYFVLNCTIEDSSVLCTILKYTMALLA